MNPQGKKKDLNDRARKAGAAGRVTTKDLYDCIAAFNSSCFWCDCQLDFVNTQSEYVPNNWDMATFDHLISLRSGGLGFAFNLVPACYGCNNIRNNMEQNSWQNSFKHAKKIGKQTSMALFDLRYNIMQS